MKNIVPLLFSILFATIYSSSLGQQCNLTTDNVSPVTLRIKSTEITTLTVLFLLVFLVVLKQFPLIG